jgi:tRNA dimethylallyltransferase
MSTLPRVLVVAGPTASGKSALALCLAEELNGVILNADSIQCYRDLPTLTARPAASDQSRAPHRLYGFLEPTVLLSATAWATQVANAIRDACAAGQQPIVVGGTGFYLKALMEGLADIPAVPPEVRQAAQSLIAEKGTSAVHALLNARDPVSAARIKPADTQRITRAWEVLEATGMPLSTWQAQPTVPGFAADYKCILVQPSRDDLYTACDQRFEQMLTAGALAEVGDLGLPTTAPVMRALGASELADHLAGKTDLATAKQLAQAATRHYAKRQTTWFRHQFRKDFVISTQFSESLFREIFPEIRRLLLT